MKKSIIAFRRQKLVCPDDFQDNKNFVATANAELMRFGYMLTDNAFNMLAKSDPFYIKNWITDVSTYLSHAMGDGDWKPLHAGFPKTVMESSLTDLYIAAIMHYWSKGEYYPDQKVAEAGYEYEYTEYKMVEYSTEDEFLLIFKSLVQVNQSITAKDMETIEWFADNYTELQLKDVMPPVIPFKENLMVLAGKGFLVPVSTPTDVLRLGNYFSGNKTDLTIPPKTIKTSQWNRTQIPNPEYVAYKFGPFTQSRRRQLLSILNDCAYISEMANRIESWKRFGEVLHPGDYVKQYPLAVNAFTVIRRGRPKTWFSNVNKAFNEGYDVGIAKLCERPGVFARALDSLVRQGPGKMNPERVLNPFRRAAINVSNKVLFELLEHFKTRNKSVPRSVWIKGYSRPTPLPTLTPLDESVIEEIISTIWTVFSDKFALLEPLGAVWIDEDLKGIPVPTNMRETSEALITTVRGQRTAIVADKKVLRSYVHWTEGMDLDIHMEFCNKDGTGKTTCSYHNLRPIPGVHHSGDIAPHHSGNHAEYIDIELDKIDRDYALMIVQVYRGTGLKDSNACIGFMQRDTPTSGNATWRPDTVTNAVRIENNSTAAAFFLVDLRNKEWIWIDESLVTDVPISIGNSIKYFVDRYAELPELSAWHILMMHAEARGRVTNDRAKANTLFKLEDFDKSYENLLSYML